MTGVDPASLAGADSGFVALTDACGLLGFRSFGSDGQVPGGTYDDSALDPGGGLRPELTGKGLGRPAIQAGLAYGRARFSPLGLGFPAVRQIPMPTLGSIICSSTVGLPTAYGSSKSGRLRSALRLADPVARATAGSPGCGGSERLHARARFAASSRCADALSGEHDGAVARPADIGDRR